jgi:GTP cyclohydrolase II
MSAVASEGRGVVVYSRGQEGRGIGLISKLKAYALQDRGMDTIDANVALGLPVDGRDYGVGSKILHDLGVRSLRLITNNPEKIRALVSLGLPVTQRVPSLSVPTVENASYLRAKHERMGHHVIAEELPAGRKAHPDD